MFCFSKPQNLIRALHDLATFDWYKTFMTDTQEFENENVKTCLEFKNLTI
jgi:hypothetical protein